MKSRFQERIGLSLLFSLIVFVIFLITALIVALITYFIIKSNQIYRLGNYGHFVPVLIILFACVVVGTIVSLVMGRYPLRPLQEVIYAINKLASGEFSTRLHISHPSILKELGESFNRMAEELGGIELLRTDFVNNFSHEFKTPIVSIKGFAKMLKYDDLSAEERNEYLDIVISESNRLALLATNVLNLSKIENQTILTEMHSFNLGEQIRRSILMLESKWAQKKIILSIDIQDINYLGTEELLNQVWLNLLDNAIKFTPKNGNINIVLKQIDHQVEFILSDSGCGISHNNILHIFDKFYQADTSHTTEGNGLGLTLVKKIILLHKGSIECKSEIDNGTEFIVKFPV